MAPTIAQFKKTINKHTSNRTKNNKKNSSKKNQANITWVIDVCCHFQHSPIYLEYPT